MDRNKGNFPEIISQNHCLRGLACRNYRSSEKGETERGRESPGSWGRRRQVEREPRHSNEAGQVLEHAAGRAVCMVGCRVLSCPETALLAPKTFNSWKLIPLGLDNS